MTLISLQQYGPAFQIKVISSLLTHKDFLTNIHDIISEEYWDNQAHKWIIKEILKYYDKYHTTPSMDIIKVELKKVENEVLQIAVKEQLREAYQASDEDLKYVQEEFSTFCKNQQLKKALLNSVDLLKAGDYDSIKLMIESAMKAGQEKNVGHEYNKDIESRFREDSRKVVPTPWERVNDLTQGGLGNGDFGLIFGNPGGGKSWSLVALGGYAVRLGFNVVHYTLELGEDYVGRRYDAFFTKIPVDKILKSRNKVEEIIPQLPGELIIKEFPTGRATISTIESHLKKVDDLGVKPDLVIIDYVDLLGTRKKTSDRKGEIDDIYTSTKGLARELNIPIWSVSQVNRAGAKDDVIEGDKAAGSYDKIMITDFCMSLSRKAKDKVNGTGRFHIMKNRYGMDGLTFGVQADTSTGHFEVHDYDPEDEELELTPKRANSYDEVDQFDKKMLANKFFELNS
ncbi:MAG: AAA family ATPase [Winogradskyella sp.]|uniref:DnaB-like helicase C-terminal domain-containing protein n=1 Tax=Winogradskyella sp. TaxID=1883156 RepID=UPI00182AFDC2|nr:AAA family ATPase [Winogradskyella sp.]